MEPPPIPDRAVQRQPAPRPQGQPVVPGTTLHGAVVGACLGACAVGLAGGTGGLVWLVAGVWALRWTRGANPGLAWGIALLTAGFRWGTAGLAGVQAASRTVGPALATKPTLAAAGTAVAMVAALLEEARHDRLRDRDPVLAVIGFVALLSLVVGTTVPGPGGEPVPTSLAAWFVAGTIAATTVLAGRGPGGWMPGWSLPAVAAAGTLMVGVSAV